MPELQIDPNILLETTKQQLKTSIKMKCLNQKNQHHPRKEVHCQYFGIINQWHIDKKSSLTWPKSQKINCVYHMCNSRECHSYKAYKKAYPWNNRRWYLPSMQKKKKDETTQHIISGYSVLATTKYIERHDKIHAYLSSKEIWIPGNVSKWYNYNPEPQFDSDLAKIL